MNLSPRQRKYLELMGVEVWVSRQPENILPEKNALPGKEDRWKALQEEVAACKKCPLHRTRSMAVFGTGNEKAGWMVIGEAPGADEDRQGKPFVGRAGKLLTRMLQSIGLDRDEVYITNILKSRPPKNRDPSLEEVEACESFLKQQIDYIRPRIILALGRIAAQNLLKVNTPLGRMRGRGDLKYPEFNIPVVVTYHPAYLLRSPKEKAKAWEDLNLAMKIYKEIRP